MLWLMRSNEDLDSLDILSYFIKASKRKKNAIFKIICSTKSLEYLNFFGSKNLQTLILHPNSKAAVFFSFVTPASANILCCFVLFALKELKLLIDFFW